jgi:hypothetical protein
MGMLNKRIGEALKKVPKSPPKTYFQWVRTPTWAPMHPLTPPEDSLPTETTHQTTYHTPHVLPWVSTKGAFLWPRALPPVQRWFCPNFDQVQKKSAELTLVCMVVSRFFRNPIQNLFSGIQNYARAIRCGLETQMSPVGI